MSTGTATQNTATRITAMGAVWCATLLLVDEQQVRAAERVRLRPLSPAEEVRMLEQRARRLIEQMGRVAHELHLQ